jgi:hypothetical protein
VHLFKLGMARRKEKSNEIKPRELIHFLYIHKVKNGKVLEISIHKF